MPRIVEEFNDFAQRMARTNIDPDNPLRKPLMVKNRWLFWNGARSDGKEHYVEPPEHELELIALRVEYVTALLDQAKHRYTELRVAVAEQADYFKANAGASPDDQFPGWRPELEQLAKRIESLKSELRSLLARGRELQGPDPAAEHHRYRDGQRTAAGNIARELAQLPNY